MLANFIKNTDPKIKYIYEMNQVKQEDQITGNKDDLYERQNQYERQNSLNKKEISTK